MAKGYGLSRAGHGVNIERIEILEKARYPVKKD